MGMTIDDSIKELLINKEDDTYVLGNETIDFAINTMRKYQKITEILNSASYTENGTVYSYTYDEDTRVRHIREVIND